MSASTKNETKSSKRQSGRVCFICTKSLHILQQRFGTTFKLHRLNEANLAQLCDCVPYHDTGDLQERLDDWKEQGKSARSMYVCCQHFDDHSHVRTNQSLSFKQERSVGPAASLPRIDMAATSRGTRGRPSDPGTVPLPPRVEKKSKPKKHHIRLECRKLRKLKLDIDKASTESYPTTRYSKRKRVHPPESVFGANVTTIDEALADCERFPGKTVDLKKVVALLQRLKTHVKEEHKFTLRAFALYRKDLYLWTGFRHVNHIIKYFIDPLLKYYLKAQTGSEHRELPRADRVPILDRVIWTFMYMWTTDSFSTLHQRLLDSGDLVDVSRRSFVDSLKTVMLGLGAVCRRLVKLPTLREWESKNKQQNGEEFAYVVKHMEGISNPPKSLYLIIDGTSCTLHHPTRFRTARGFWVRYAF